MCFSGGHRRRVGALPSLAVRGAAPMMSANSRFASVVGVVALLAAVFAVFLAVGGKVTPCASAATCPADDVMDISRGGVINSDAVSTANSGALQVKGVSNAYLLYTDPTNGRVGVNTSAPSNELELVGQLNFSETGVTDTVVGHGPSDGNFYITQGNLNGSVRVEISGNAGLLVGGTGMSGSGIGSGDVRIAGDFDMVTAGKKLLYTEGTNACMGTDTLSSGTKAVSTTCVSANSRIFLTLQGCTSCGALYIASRVAGTSFTVTSTNGSDGSVFAWMIVEPS